MENSGRVLRVLVVEDEPLIARDLELILESHCMSVIGPCASVAEAMAALARETPDSALIDIRLRDGASFDLARELKRRRIDFAFVTGMAGVIDLPDALKNARMISKPFHPDEIAQFPLGASRRRGNPMLEKIS